MSFPISSQKAAGTHTLYVRNSGDDANPGTLAAPLATLDESVARMVDDPVDRLRQVVDCQGFIDNTAADLRLDLPHSSFKYEFELARAGGLDDGKEDIWDLPIEFRADPTLVTTVTVTSVDTDTVTELVTINVSDTLTPGALVGKFVWKGLFAQSVIQANTTSQLIVSGNTDDYSGSLEIYEQSCQINRPIHITSSAVVGFNGILFNNQVFLRGKQRLIFSRCYFDSASLAQYIGLNFFLSCYHTGGSFRSDGAGYLVSGSVLQGVELQGRGTGGKGTAAIAFSVLDDCTPVGAGDFESATTLDISNALITNARTHGIHRLGPYNSTANRVRINDSADDAVLIDTGGGHHKMNRVVGTGNGGVGLRLQNGAQCLDEGNNTVTGTGGDIIIGGSAASTWVTATPRTDVGEAAPQFCRLF